MFGETYCEVMAMYHKTLFVSTPVARGDLHRGGLTPGASSLDGRQARVREGEIPTAQLPRRY